MFAGSGTKCDKVWYKVWQSLVQGITRFGTRCQKVWYKVLQGLVQGVTKSGTRCQKVRVCQTNQLNFRDSQTHRLTEFFELDIRYVMRIKAHGPELRISHKQVLTWKNNTCLQMMTSWNRKVVSRVYYESLYVWMTNLLEKVLKEI